MSGYFSKGFARKTRAWIGTLIVLGSPMLIESDTNPWISYDKFKEIYGESNPNSDLLDTHNPYEIPDFGEYKKLIIEI